MTRKGKIWLIVTIAVLAVGTTSFFIIRSRRKGLKGSKSIKSKIPSANDYSSFGTQPLEVASKFESLAFGKYTWAGGSGMPIDIKLIGETPLFTKMADGSTYCTGFTFSVCFTCSLNRGLLEDFTDADIKEMHKVWNQGDAKNKPKLCVDAISKPISSNLKALGKEVSLEQSEANDFCQIWRTTGSGHSVILVEKIIKDGKITGIKYFSSNASVNPRTGRTGVGENTEYFSDSGGKMIRENTYFARLN
jgi:hypothetical protein